MSSQQVEAKFHWEWTQKAVDENKFQSIEVGTPVWDNYRKKAPKRWLDEGLIREAGQETFPSGQAAFDF